MVSLETASKPYDCATCLAAYRVALQCPRSFRRHSQNKSHVCRRCAAVFNTPEQLKCHLQLPCSVKVEEEDGSNHAFLRRHRSPSSSRSQELGQSVPAKSPGKDGLFECDRCKETFQYRSLLVKHLPYHSYQYSCGVCKKAYVKKVDLLDHLQIMHDGRMAFRCKYCETRFTDISEFDSHVITHKDGLVVPCLHCSKIFSSSRKMQVHMTVAHGVSQAPTLVCQVCGKRFNQAKYLTIHMRVAHGGIQACKSCKVCGKKFKQVKLLTAHMKVAHKTLWPVMTNSLSCKICHKALQNKQGLGAHYRLRHGMSLAKAMLMKDENKSKHAHDILQDSSASQVKPSISTTVVQNKIDRPSIDIDSTECKLCGKRYSHKRVLVSHYRKIHKVEPAGIGGKPTPCNICGQILYSAHGFKIHYKLRHKRRKPQELVDFDTTDTAAPSSTKPVVSSNSRPVATPDPKQAAISKPIAAYAPKPHTTLGLKSSGQRGCRCGKCGKMFLYNWSLIRHQRLYHSISHNAVKTALNPESMVCVKVVKPPVASKKKARCTCHVCGKEYVLYKTMRMHVKAEHPDQFEDHRIGGRKCPKCKRNCRSRIKMLFHMKKCIGTQKGKIDRRPVGCGRFKCTVCERKFNWKQSALRHIMSNHLMSKETAYSKISYQNMSNHLNIAPSQSNTGDLQRFFLCKVCKVCFPLKRGLERHIKRRHEGQTNFFKCRFRHCESTFMENNALLHHVKTAHPDFRVYYCHTCCSGFSTSKELFRHRCHPRILKHRDASVSSSQCDDNDDQWAENMDSFPVGQECRYRCMTCDMGFHTAREWTKHMQAHNDPDNAAPREQAVETTDKIRLSVFDVMLGSTFSCKSCKAVFKDETEMSLHSCRQPAGAYRSPKKPHGKKPESRNLEPVQCPVCLKNFSPLSIRKHMKNIHSLPCKFCSKCRIVFTNLKHYVAHIEFHSQHDGRVENQQIVSAYFHDDHLQEDPASLDDEDPVTLFVCQACGGLFSDADSLGSHACTGENGEEMPSSSTNTSQHESSEVHQQSYARTGQDKSGGMDRMIGSKDPDFVAESAEHSDYPGENAEETREYHSLHEDSERSFQPRIVIGSVTSGAAAAIDTPEFGNVLNETSAGITIKTEISEDGPGMHLLASYGFSSEELGTNGPTQINVSLPGMYDSVPSHKGAEESLPALQEESQTTAPLIPVEKLPLSSDPVENGVADHGGMETEDTERSESGETFLHREEDTHQQETLPEETLFDGEADTDQQETLPEETLLDKEADADQQETIPEETFLDKEVDTDQQETNPEETLLDKEVDTDQQETLPEETLLDKEVDTDQQETLPEETLLDGEADTDQQETLPEETLLDGEADADQQETIPEETLLDGEANVNQQETLPEETLLDREVDTGQQETLPEETLLDGEADADQQETIPEETLLDGEADADQQETIPEETLLDKEADIDQQETIPEETLDKEAYIDQQETNPEETLLDREADTDQQETIPEETLLDREADADQQETIPEETLLDKEADIDQQETNPEETLLDREADTNQQETI